MAITYLSGERIQGSTTGGSVTTSEQNVFNLSYTTEKQAAITSGNDPTGKCVLTHNASNPESKAYATLTNSYNSKNFTVDFTIERNSSDTANNWGIFLGSDVWDDNGASGDNKRLTLRCVNGNRVDFMLDIGGETTPEDNDMTLQGTSTTKYYRITGNGTTAKCEYWASSARSGTADESTGDLTFPTAWLTKDSIDVVTFGAWGGGGNAINVEFSDVEISFTTASDEKATITNVPEGIRYEETDTRKIFRRSAGDENVGTSGTGGDWAEVVFDASTSVNNMAAVGNVVSRSSGSGWNSYIRSSVNKLSPATGGGEVYFTDSSAGGAVTNNNCSFGLEKTPFNSAPSATHTSRDYSFHTTHNGDNNIYENSTSHDGTRSTAASNEYRITMASNGTIVYYWRASNSGGWTTERTTTGASGDYYVSVTINGNTADIACFIKADANPSWKEKGTA